jgi:hypothetical protein
VAAFALYVGADWVLLANIVSGHETAPTPPTRDASLSAGVTMTVHVIDGPTLYCSAGANRVVADRILVSASAVLELIRQFQCWDSAKMTATADAT